jgi:Uma2 family endonuclease
MTQLPLTGEVQSTQKMTFEEYRFYQGEPDIRYELFEGHLEAMPPATGLHTAICEFLAACLQRYIAERKLPLVARTSVGVRTDVDSSRIPDLVVCSRGYWDGLLARSGAGVFDTGETPLLVVEVVSEDRRRDYIRKRAEYALIEIPEYWIVDPDRRRVWILSDPLSENGYERSEFVEGQALISRQFPELVLSVEEVLAPVPTEDLLQSERQRLVEEREQAAQERERAERERERAEQERERAERERERAEQERQSREAAEQERDAQRLRSEQLEAYLRRLNIDPDTAP